MNQLGRDVRNIVLEKLNSDDILRLCRTDKAHNELCESSKFREFWRKRIYDEFGVRFEGSDTFQEFKFLYRLGHTKIYTVQEHFDDNPDELDEVWIFYDLNTAVEFIGNLIYDRYVENKNEDDLISEYEEIVEERDEALANHRAIVVEELNKLLAKHFPDGNPANRTPEQIKATFKREIDDEIESSKQVNKEGFFRARTEYYGWTYDLVAKSIKWDQN